ncbi:hypothetical protein D3C87_1619320 [compost metagenome]
MFLPAVRDDVCDAYCPISVHAPLIMASIVKVKLCAAAGFSKITLTPVIPCTVDANVRVTIPEDAENVFAVFTFPSTTFSAELSAL